MSCGKTEEGVNGVSSAWREFWFAAIPPHSYALYRIAIGIAGVATVIGAWDPAFWRVGDLAPLPQGGFGFQEWVAVNGWTDPAAVLVRGGLLLGYLCLLAGYQSVFTAVAMFIGSSAMLWWNYYPFSGAQHLLHNLILYLVFVDSGRVWSLDAWLARRRGTPLEPTPQPYWPLRLVRAQIAIMYFAAGFWKLGNPVWRGGDALHYILNSNVFQRMPGNVPAELYPVTVLLTYVTIFWELLFPFMLWWRPTRAFAVALGVALHIGMWSTIEIGSFSLTVLAGYTAFLNPYLMEARVARAAAWLRRAPIQESPISTPAS
jgi:hypothetical protein